MESLMRVGFGVLCKGAKVACCLFLALQPRLVQIDAQNSTRKAVDSPGATRSMMIEKGHVLEARGRPDLAVQVWQQVLLSDPKNTEALAGLARDQKLTGSEKAIDAPDRLRKASPSDSNIARIQGSTTTGAEKAQPRQTQVSATAKPAPSGKSRTPVKGRAQVAKTAPPRKTPTVEDAQAPSQFGSVMNEAKQAFNQNQFDVAATKYREALTMNPQSPEALNGLASSLTKQQQFASAALIYDQLTKVQPNSIDAWRGLFFSYARDSQNQNVIAVEARIPASVKAALAADPEYLHSLIAIYQAENRPADVQRVVAEAMSLPFPDNGTSLKPETKLDYAAILIAARRYDQAVALYAQVLADDPGNLSAWEGLIGAHHAMELDTTAIDDIKKMQPSVYEAAIADPSFLTVLGSIYEQASQYEVAQSLLERAVKLQVDAGNQPSVALQLELAGIYLLRDDPAHAYDLYHQVLQNIPDRAEAWKGLIAALLATNRDIEALQQLVLIPRAIRKNLEADIEFVQTEASLYAATGDIARAIEFMNRVQAHYARLHTDPPAAIEIQNAWLLFNTRNDRALYPVLMHLNSRPGLTVAQRETTQDIWANWSVRRASDLIDNGNVQQAVDILDAAFQAFPDNLSVRKAVAGVYVLAGRAKESLALYKTISMQDATAADFQGAVGAALAANDKNQAELWLRQALEHFPRDPAILSLAGHYEQARGDNQRAAAYYRASLAAMPPASPTEKLARVLVYPDRDTRAHCAVTAADLERLLDPNNEPFRKTTKLPPLPAYGVDPYNGSAPQQSPIRQIPSTNRSEVPTQPIYVPQSYSRPSKQTASDQLHRQRSATPILVRNPLPIKRACTRPHLMYATFQINPRHSIDPILIRTNWVPQVSHLRPGRPPIHRSIISAALTASQTLQKTSTQPAPNTQVSDAWKNLIRSLLADNQNAEAMRDLSRVPPDIRLQLESDVEFVQSEADLYLSVGDIAHAAEVLNHEEKLYRARHAAVPAAVELKHAFLLDNLTDDPALRPLLQRLDARADLNPSQRRQIEGLWSHYAARQPAAQAQLGVKANPSANLAPYMGKMNVPPAEETVDTTAPVSSSASSQFPRRPPVRKPGAAIGAPDPAPSLRIASQPMGPVAAQAQALFADQTDSQLTQGSAAVIHNLANAPVNSMPTPPGSSQYNVAQYTPSAQDAVTGAYSAPRRKQPQPTPPPASTRPLSTPPSPKPSAAQSSTKKRAKAAAATTSVQVSQNRAPTLGQATEQGSGSTQQVQSPPQQAPVPSDIQSPTPPPTTDTGLSDEELQQRNLPPLRGPWVRIQRQPNLVSPREEAEMQLHSIEAGYSPWLGGTGLVNYRPGSLGYDHLAALEAPFEVSMPLGLNTRVSIVAKPVFLDSGQADGTSVMTVQESTTSGTTLVSIPQPIGTLTDPATTIPVQQNASGVGGEVQLAFPHLALAGGYTPEGLLVATFTGRAYWKPANGPFTLNFSRDPVRDTQLSYAGLRDPGGNTHSNLGQIWGGVVANQGQVRFSHANAESGFYLGAGGQYLSGHQVQINTRIDGSGGAYWHLKTIPEYGDLSVGAAFFSMHYEHNEDAFTHGMGGYFSPQTYFLANVPFTWVGHYGTYWHYNILGGLGVQAFQQDLTPLWPLAVDKPLETTLNNAMLPAKTSVGPNYDVRSQVSYQFGPHWFADGFIGANNSRNYSAVNAGFSIHYMFRIQPSTATGPTGIFPTDGVRPFTVP
jgi:tetratricopeptide (TPR) repeat protein